MDRAMVCLHFVCTSQPKPATRLNFFLEVGVVWQCKADKISTVLERFWRRKCGTKAVKLNKCYKLQCAQRLFASLGITWDICRFWYIKWTWIIFREALIITLLLYFLRSLGVVTCGWVIKLTHWPTGQVDPSTKSNLLAITFYLMSWLTYPYGRV